MSSVTAMMARHAKAFPINIAAMTKSPRHTTAYMIVVKCEAKNSPQVKQEIADAPLPSRDAFRIWGT